MFKIIAGDFSIQARLQNVIGEDTLFLFDFMGWQHTKTKLNNNIENIELLSSDKIKEFLYDAEFAFASKELSKALEDNKTVCFICNLKGGKSFTAVSDLKTFHKLQIIESTETTEDKFQKFNSRYQSCLITSAIIFGVFFMVIFPFLPEDNKFEEIGLSEVQGIAITEALTKCGIDEIDTIEELDKSDHSYKISTKDADYIIIYLNKNKVNRIELFPQKTLYKNGKVIAKISDFVLPYDEALQVKQEVEDLVRNSLKAPSTAQFPDNSEWKIWKEKKVTYVESYVDSQNSFGAMIRGTFQVKIVNDRIVFYVLNGKRFI